MPLETLKIILALLAFGIFHSLTAALGFKAMMAALLGTRAYLGLYRLLYNTISVISLAPVFWLMWQDPGANIWAVDGTAALVIRALNWLGLIGVVVSILQIDALRFAGITQVIAYLTGGRLPLPEEPLSRRGLYGLVRHPLYLFSLIWLWALPIMSAAWLGFAIGATIYFVVGSYVEEKKLVRQFGAAYIDYQQRVPWLFPGG